LKNRSYIDVSTRNNNGVATKTIYINQLWIYEKIFCSISSLVWPYGAIFKVIMISDAKYFAIYTTFTVIADHTPQQGYNIIGLVTL